MLMLHKTNYSFCLIPSQEANKPPDTWFELKVNTHVYVTGLPEDVTTDEVSGGYFNFLLFIFQSYRMSSMILSEVCICVFPVECHPLSLELT